MKQPFDIIIIGGSYAGLSAALSLGRAMRSVLVIDGGQPCNRQTPHSHNFITQDGETPANIARAAKEQVLRYPTVQFHDGFVDTVEKSDIGFRVTTSSGNSYQSKKIILATGLKDTFPEIPGFAECWGISVIHCPYCHGYEVRHTKTGILANGPVAFHYAQLISNWTKELVIYTNGPSNLTDEQLQLISANNIQLVETPVAQLQHTDGQLKSIQFSTGETHALTAIYARPDYVQHAPFIEQLGCALSDHGLIVVDEFQQTSVPGVYACGDNSGMRAVAKAVSSGTMAGAALNNHLCAEEFMTAGQV